MLNLILLGVGTAVPDVDRECTHMVVQTEAGLLLVDAGGSTYQRLLRAGLDPLTLRGIVLTHAHADHINGLPAVLFQLALAGFQGRLPIYGNAPTLERMRLVVEAMDMGRFQAAVDWKVVEPGAAVETGDPAYTLVTAPTVHPKPCLALRFETPRGALVLSADTEPCPLVEALAQGAAILVHEATTAEPFPGHTTPLQCGEVAQRAGAGRLVLVHFSPRYTMPEEQALAAVRAGGFQGPAEIGQEFGRYEV